MNPYLNHDDPRLWQGLWTAHGASDEAIANMKKKLLPESLFSWAIPVGAYEMYLDGRFSALGKIIHGVKSAKNFLYDKTSGLLMADFTPSGHGIMMAHLEALARKDKTSESPAWNFLSFSHDTSEDPVDALDELADSYILEGRGALLSGASKTGRLTIAQRFQWGSMEKVLFRHLLIDEITDK